MEGCAAWPGPSAAQRILAAVNPDRQPQPLRVERVEWIPSSPDEIEVRVYGVWHGATVPPAVSLVIGNDIVAPLADPPPPGLAPAWSSAYMVTVEARVELEAGNAAVVGPDFAVPLPAAEPGAMDGPPGTVVDPKVLAERRARRAELAEESAAARAASAEETVETLRAQLGHLEERAARAGAERDSIAARVGDAERRLRLAEQREEAERRRRTELEEDVASSRRGAESEIEDLRARLAGAEEHVETLERELAHARRQTADAIRTAEAETGALRAEADSLRARAAEADALRAEAEALRARAAEADALRAEADALRARAAEAESLRAEADALRARAAEAESLRAEAEALRAEADALRVRAAQADALRAEADALRARAAQADALRAEADALRARAAQADALRAEADALRARADAADAFRVRAAELEERLAAAPAASSSEHERALVAHVATLERELARRAAVQERVQEAISVIREELSHVRAQVESARPAGAPDVASLAALRDQLLTFEEHRRSLEAALRAREVEMGAARNELERARDAAADARAEAERERQGLAVAEQSAAEARRVAAELRDRLASEQAARAAVEEQLARRGAAAETPADLPTTDDPALDTLIAGLRAQVADARRQLEQWGGGEPRPEAPPTAERAAESPAFAAEPPGEPPALDEPLPPKPADWRPAERERDQAQEPAPEPPEDATRARLQAIAAELRAAVPEEGGTASRHDVIADLQRAAERLRAAAEHELERLEQPGGEAAAAPLSPPPPDVATAPAGRAATPADVARPGDAVRTPPSDVAAGAEPRDLAPPPPDLAATEDAAPQAAAAAQPPTDVADWTSSLALARARTGAAPIEELGARWAVPATDEGPWLRVGLERLASSDPGTAAQLLAALLPAQALVAEDLAYDLTAPAVGTLRVVIEGGLARVEPRDAPGPREEVDVLVEGPLEALAPLAAGGAGWWLRGVRTHGSRRRLRRLVKARRRPVGLGELGLAGSPVHPGLLLAALAAAVEPASTRGHRLAVTYAVGGDGAWIVEVADGAPLAVRPYSPDRESADATVVVSAPAFMPLLAGHEPPRGERASVVGERRAVDLLHGWFDTARGAGQQ